MNKNLSILSVTIALIGCMVAFLSSCTDTYDEDVMGKIRQTPENTLSTNTARELQHFNDGLESSMTQTRGDISNVISDDGIEVGE